MKWNVPFPETCSVSLPATDDQKKGGLASPNSKTTPKRTPPSVADRTGAVVCRLQEATWCGGRRQRGVAGGATVVGLRL